MTFVEGKDPIPECERDMERERSIMPKVWKVLNPIDGDGEEMSVTACCIFHFQYHPSPCTCVLRTIRVSPATRGLGFFALTCNKKESFFRKCNH